MTIANQQEVETIDVLAAGHNASDARAVWSRPILRKLSASDAEVATNTGTDTGANFS
jgi:hypothetical protein